MQGTLGQIPPTNKLPPLMGIDLAGSEKRQTGWAVLAGGNVYSGILNTDDEIMATIHRFGVKKVIMDAPLSLPRGRKDIDLRDEHHFRECDLKLRREGIRFFPVTLGPMRMLTKRGMHLKGMLEQAGVVVFEGFPGASYDRFGVPRKDISAIQAFLSQQNFPSPLEASQDELDGLILLLTLYLKEMGQSDPFTGSDGEILAPPRLRDSR